MIHTLRGAFRRARRLLGPRGRAADRAWRRSALGACVVERHITLDRAMWGTDQAASLEPGGLERLVRDVRVIERAMGDGRKTLFEGELPMREKLRRT